MKTKKFNLKPYITLLNLILLLGISFMLGYHASPFAWAQETEEPPLTGNPAGLPQAAFDFGQCVGSTLGNYMNAVMQGTSSHRNVSITTPAINCTSETCSAVIYEMYLSGADFENVDAITMNVYQIGENSVTDFLDQKFAEIQALSPQLATILTQVPLVLTEVGLRDGVDPEKFYQSLQDLTTGVYYSQGPSFGSASGTPPNVNIFSPDGFNSDFEDQMGFCDSYDCTQWGNNPGLPIGDNQIDCSVAGRSCVAIVTSPDQAQAAIDLINGSAGDVIIRACYADSCEFQSSEVYSDFINRIAEAVCPDGAGSDTCKNFSVLAGPNEPDLEPWLTPECGLYINILLGAQQCVQGEIGPFTSRASECGSCFNYVPDPTLACAGNFTYNKLIPYTSFDVMNCSQQQCSLDVNTCSLMIGDDYIGDLEEPSDQLLVGPLPWQGRFHLNADSTVIPFVGNDTEESRERYIADYVDGVLPYSSDIDPGSEPPPLSADPAEIYRRDAVAYYDLPPNDPRYFSYAGIVNKLAPQEYIDEMRHQLLARVHQDNYQTILLPINAYQLRDWTGSQTHLDKFIDEPNVPGSADRAHIKPRLADFGGYTPAYWQAMETWQNLDRELNQDYGKWQRLWSYIPLTSRQDTPGMFEPIPQEPARVERLGQSDDDLDTTQFASSQPFSPEQLTATESDQQLAWIPIDDPPVYKPADPADPPPPGTIKEGQDGDNAFGNPLSAPPSEPLPYPSPVQLQLQLPHLARLYESQNLLNGLLAPYEGFNLKFGADATPVINTADTQMASSQIYSPSNSTTQIAQAIDPGSNNQGDSAIPAQCVSPDLPPGCFPGDNPNCYQIGIQNLQYSQQRGEITYGVRAEMTCGQYNGGLIDGAIGDCFWQMYINNSAAGTNFVRSIKPIPGGTYIKTSDNHGGAFPVVDNVKNGSEGSLRLSLTCNRDINRNGCCAKTQDYTCTYQIVDGELITDCKNTPYVPPGPLACRPTTLGSVPSCDGVLRSGPGDELCGAETFDLIIDQPDDTFWNTNPFQTMIIDSDGDVDETTADGQHDLSYAAASQCGFALTCDECNCSGTTYQVNCDPDGTNCEDICCAPGGVVGDKCVNYPDDATPNLCDEDGFSCKTDDGIPACYGAPNGSTEIIADQNYTPQNSDAVLSNVQNLTAERYREVHLRTHLPYLGSIYDQMIGDPSEPGDGLTDRFTTLTKPTFRMVTPYRGVLTPEDKVPWYKFHGGSASGILNIVNLGGGGTNINGAGAGLSSPFFFPYLGGIQDGVQFVRDCLTVSWPNGCSPPEVKELIEGVTCIASFNKLSFYANSVDQDLITWVKQAQPTTIKLMDGAIRRAGDIKSNSPNTLVVARVFSDEYDGINGISEADFANLDTAIAKAESWFAQHEGEIRANPNVDYWEGYNEPVADDELHMRWFARFELRRMQLLSQIGAKACIGNFAVGNPNPQLWPAFEEAFQFAALNGHPVCLHEYAKAPDFTVDGFLLGRFESMYDYLATIGRDTQIQTIISETGVTGSGAASSGWRKILDNDTQRFLEIMRQYDEYISTTSPYANQIIGGTLYIYGHDAWPNQEMKGDVMDALLNGSEAGADGGSLSCYSNNPINTNNPSVQGCFVFDNTWSPEHKAKMQTELNYLASNHPKYVNKICAGGTTYLNYQTRHPSGNNYYGFCPQNPGNTCTFYNNALTSTPSGLYYTMVHEFAHRINWITGTSYSGTLFGQFYEQVLCQPGDNSCEDYLPSYRWTKSAYEDFAETAAWYTAKKRNNSCLDGYPCYRDMPIDYPLHYNFAATKLVD